MEPKIPDVIAIYSPVEIPFGALSNNAFQEMVIDGHKWPTVTNYVFSHMLTIPSYKANLHFTRIQNPKKTNIEARAKAVIDKMELAEGKKLTPSEKEYYRQLVLRDVSIEKMDIYELYNFFLGKERYYTIFMAMENAYDFIAKNYPDFTKKLFDTDNRPLVYRSNNTELGIDDSGFGWNILGIVLMQLRHRLSTKLEEEEKNTAEKLTENTLRNTVVSIYKIYQALMKELYDGNLLDEYVGLTWQELADIVNYRDIIADDDVIMAMYEKGTLPYVESEILTEGSLVSYLRKTELPKAKDALEQKRYDTIFSAYTDFLITEKYPNLSEEQKSELTNNLKKEAPSDFSYYELRKEVYLLYVEDKLPEELIEFIRIEEAQVQVPTEEDVLEAQEEVAESAENTESSRNSSRKSKKFKNRISRQTGIEKILSSIRKENKKPEQAWQIEVVKKGKTKEKIALTHKPTSNDLQIILDSYNDKHKHKITQENLVITSSTGVEILESGYIKPMGEPVEIRDDSLLSPMANYEIKHSSTSFPNSYMYMIVAMAAHEMFHFDVRKNQYIKGNSIDSVLQEFIVGEQFTTLANAWDVYNRLHVENYKELLRIYTSIALHKKFEDVNARNLLLLTGNMKIVWNDPHDTFLGWTKKYQGENVVGKIMMEIRESEAKKETLIPLESKDLGKFMNEDTFMRGWIRLRFTDLCQTINFVKENMNIGNPDPIFVHDVLGEIYHCPIKRRSKKNASVFIEENLYKILVKNCSTLKLSFSKDYDTLINDLKNKIRETESNFVGGRNTQESEDIILDEFSFRNEQAKQYEIFKKENPSKKELKKFDKMQKEQLEKFKKILLKNPADSIEAKHLKEWEKARKKDINLDALRKKQYEERQAYYGLDFFSVDKKTREAEIGVFKQKETEHKKIIQNFKEQLEKIVMEKRQERLSLEQNRQECVVMMWRFLENSIRTLIKSMDDPTQEEIKMVLTNSILAISEKGKCKTVPVEFKNPAVNCIASALSNTITALQSLKHKNELPLKIDEDDLDTCASIILGKHVSASHVTVVISQDEKGEKFQEMERNLEEIEDEIEAEKEEEDENILIEEESDIEDEEKEDEKDEEEILEKDEKDEKDEEEIDEQAFLELEEEPEFFLGKKSPKMKTLTIFPSLYQKVRMVLVEASGNKLRNDDEMTRYFFAIMETMRTTRCVSARTKINRVNFFAESL